MRMRTLLTVGALALSSSIAIAGKLQPAPVEVTVNADRSGQAHGDMATARFSANDVEYIGCGVRKYDDGAGGATAYGFCQASDAAGVAGFCSTSNVELLDVIQNVADHSFVTFSWNSKQECQQIGISTQSFYIP